MAALNFKHLRYFWMVAKGGSIARASAQLHVTPQSISAQLRELETSLETPLLRRAGRGLELTDAGRRILRYAEEIFALGDELMAVARDGEAKAAPPFRVGVADSVPKLLSYRVVEPLLQLDEPLKLVCREGRLVSLLAELSVHRLDMVIADRPMPQDVNVRAFNHRLGASDVTVFAAPQLLRASKGKFPALLDKAPFLMPGESVAIRPALERWFESVQVRPRVIGEFDDSALLKAFGQGGSGFFAAPSAIAGPVSRQYGVRAVGRIEAVVEQLYAITTERRTTHPAILALTQAAARDVFGAPPEPGNAAVPARSGAAKAR